MIYVHHTLQFIVAIFEIWLCYQTLYVTAIEKTSLRRWERGVIWFNIILLGVLLGINRNGAFFSSVMLLFCVVVTMLFLGIVIRKNILLLCGIVISYYVVCAMLDLVFAFASMIFLEYRFNTLILLDSTSLIQILIYVGTRIIVLGIVRLLHRYDRIKKDIYEYRKILFGASLVLVYILLQVQLFFDRMLLAEREMRPGSTGVFLAIFLFVFGVIVILLMRSKMLKKENGYLQSRDMITGQMYQELAESYDRNRRMIHDIRNHLVTLRSFDEKGDYEGMHNYLKELNEEYLCEKSKAWTEIKVLDFLLNQKEMIAEKKGISFQIETMTLQKLALNDSEICSLFGNLLDNAIEACEKIKDGEKWIRIVMEKKGHMLLLKVENSTEGSILKENGELKTTKKENGVHGYGLKCVQRIVDKYEGKLSYQMEKDSFQINIIFLDV